MKAKVVIILALALFVLTACEGADITGVVISKQLVLSKNGVAVSGYERGELITVRTEDETVVLDVSSQVFHSVRAGETCTFWSSHWSNNKIDKVECDELELEREENE